MPDEILDAKTGRDGLGRFIYQSLGEKVKAVMFGNQGSTLRCLMQKADSSGFTTMGGIGECIHGDGSRIEVVW